MSVQGLPIWYELTTADADASAAFYGPVMGWQFRDAGMPDFTYTLALSGDDMVAGLMQPDSPMPTFWMVYFAVDDCDAATAQVTALGGAVHRPPEDIPGTGRFAIVTDPQGAVFGLLQPGDGKPGTAFDQKRRSHGNWHDLQTSDPGAALSFYSTLLGWKPGVKEQMGPDMTYQLITASSGDIGGIMPLQAPGLPPHWTPYFGTEKLAPAIDTVKAQGGKLLHGPAEVPGGAMICHAADPQGAVFALVSPS